MSKEWCEIDNVLIPRIEKDKKTPKRARCTKCKKRFKPLKFLRWYGVEVWLPKHKKVIK